MDQSDVENNSGSETDEAAEISRSAKKAKERIKCLQPLVDFTLDLQKESANAETAVNVIRYIKILFPNN